MTVKRKSLIPKVTKVKADKIQSVMKNIDPVLYVVEREKPEPHYEVHFDKRVEFWTLDGRSLGSSKVYKYPDKSKGK